MHLEKNFCTFKNWSFLRSATWNDPSTLVYDISILDSQCTCSAKCHLPHQIRKNVTFPETLLYTYPVRAQNQLAGIIIIWLWIWHEFPQNLRTFAVDAFNRLIRHLNFHWKLSDCTANRRESYDGVSNYHKSATIVNDNSVHINE